MNEEMIKELKKQSFWMKLTSCFMGGIFLVVLIAALTLVPKANSILSGAEQTLNDVNVAVEELNETAGQLAEIDFKGLAEDTQRLVSEGSEGIQQAIGKLEGIDIEGLNKAIDDFGAVVSPLSKLFGKR